MLGGETMNSLNLNEMLDHEQKRLKELTAKMQEKEELYQKQFNDLNSQYQNAMTAHQQAKMMLTGKIACLQELIEKEQKIGEGKVPKKSLQHIAKDKIVEVKESP